MGRPLPVAPRGRLYCTWADEPSPIALFQPLVLPWAADCAARDVTTGCAASSQVKHRRSCRPTAYHPADRSYTSVVAGRGMLWCTYRLVDTLDSGASKAVIPVVEVPPLGLDGWSGGYGRSGWVHDRGSPAWMELSSVDYYYGDTAARAGYIPRVSFTR